ncbi:MAG: PrsW family glutamic-type intramembrane protease [Candidatus Micrarchaeia archaeon]
MDYLGLSMYLSVGIATIILIALYSALHRRTSMTLRTLFFPDFDEFSFEKEVACIIIHPMFWISTFGILAVFTASLLFSMEESIIAYDWLFFSFILILFFAFFDPIMVWFLEGKYREPLRFVFGGISYGIIAALAAFFINSVIGILLGEIVDKQMGVLTLVILAPFFEEIIKIIGIFLISPHKMFRGPLDGILVGFSIGVGFAMTENIFYVTTRVPIYSIDLLVFRALYNTIAHGVFTAIGGAIFSKIKISFEHVGALLLAIPILVATLVHISFNIFAIIDVVSVDNFQVNYYVLSPLLVIALLLITIYLIITLKKSEAKKED